MSTDLTPRRDSWDVFVSYSRRDKAWVKSVLAALQQRHREFTGGENLELFFDEQAIEAGEPWRERLHHGLRGSHFMIAFLSGSYVDSVNCTWEWEYFERHERRRGLYGEAIGPVFFVTAPDVAGRKLEEDKIRRWLGARRWRNDLKLVSGDEAVPLDPTGEDVLQLSAVRRRLDSLDDAIIRKRALAHAVVGSPNTIPSHNPNFCGRDHELKTLRNELQARPAVVTCGLGGIGKTALAFEYAHVFAHAYPGGRYWVPCAGRKNLAEALLALGGSKLSPLGGFGLIWEPTATESERLAALRNWLGGPVPRPGAKLLVLDNVEADTPNFLAPIPDQPELLPNLSLAGNQVVHLLATSRGDLRRAVRCPLDELSEDAAVEVVRRHCAADDDAPGLAPKRALTTDDVAVVREIVRLLGGFTLAVEAVAVHLAEKPGVSLAGYRDQLQAIGVGQLDATAAKDHVRLHLHQEKLLALTLAPTLAGLAPDERLALSYAAVLPPDCVPLAWVRGCVAKTFPIVAEEPEPGREDEHRWTQVCQRLQALRLLVPSWTGLRPEEKPHVARMHRLVGEIVKQRADFPVNALSQVRSAALQQSQALYERFFESEVAAWRPALYAVVADWLRVLPTDVGSATLTNELALVQKELGDLREAKRLLKQAITTEEKAYASDHPALAVSYSNLAAVEQALGNLGEAKLLLEEAIAINEKAYASDHPALAVSYSNLAMVERDLGNLGEAKRLLEQVTAINEKTYAREHPALAVSYSNLAMVEWNLGNLGEAKRLLEQAIAIEKKAYASDHPRLAVRHSNLALVEKDLGNLGEAKRLLEQAIPIKEKAYASDHPELAVRYSNLALMEQDLGNLGEAKRLLEQAIAIDEKAYASDHPTLARDYSNLALVEQDLGNLGEAKRLLEQAITIAEKAYASDHPTLAVNYSNLALVEKDLGNLGEAKRLLEQAIAIDEKAYASDHPTLARDYSNLALVEQDLGNLGETKWLLQQAIKIKEKAHASDHPTLALSYWNLGRVYQDIDELSLARQWIAKAHAIWLSRLGPDHAHTRMVRDWLSKYGASDSPSDSAQALL